MKEMFAHMRTDPNAGKHARLGLLGCVILLAPVLTLIGLVVGIAIEVVQRVQRLFSGEKQNHLQESVLDALGTSLFYIYYYNKMYIKEK